VFAQVGNGRLQALMVFLGGIAGALGFGYAHPRILQHTNILSSTSPSSPTLQSYFKVPMWRVSVPLVLTIVCTIDDSLSVSAIARSFELTCLSGNLIQVTSLVVLEHVSPTHLQPLVNADQVDLLTEQQPSAPDTSMWQRAYNSLTKRMWSPYVCGALIGTLQIPTLVVGKATLGTSSAFVTIAQGARSLIDRSPNFYFAKFAWSLKNSWQVLQDGGIVLGSYLSTLLSGDQTHDRQAGLMVSRKRSGHETLIGNEWSSYLWSFVGGAAMLFGARLADGCTSGHGISGVAQLGVGSMVATAAMFAVGMTSGMSATLFTRCTRAVSHACTCYCSCCSSLPVKTDHLPQHIARQIMEVRRKQ
jgi:uncharacterized protein